MFCTKCGNRLANGVRYCTMCGNPVNASNPYRSPAPNPYGAPAPNPYGAPAPNPYGAPAPNPYGAPAPNPYGAPAPNPYGVPAPNPYGAHAPNPSAPPSGGRSGLKSTIGGVGLKKQRSYDTPTEYSPYGESKPISGYGVAPSVSDPVYDRKSDSFPEPHSFSTADGKAAPDFEDDVKNKYFSGDGLSLDDDNQSTLVEVSGNEVFDDSASNEVEEKDNEVAGDNFTPVEISHEPWNPEPIEESVAEPFETVREEVAEPMVSEPWNPEPAEESVAEPVDAVREEAEEPVVSEPWKPEAVEESVAEPFETVREEVAEPMVSEPWNPEPAEESVAGPFDAVREEVAEPMVSEPWNPEPVEESVISTEPSELDGTKSQGFMPKWETSENTVNFMGEIREAVPEDDFEDLRTDNKSTFTEMDDMAEEAGKISGGFFSSLAGIKFPLFKLISVASMLAVSVFFIVAMIKDFGSMNVIFENADCSYFSALHIAIGAFPMLLTVIAALMSFIKLKKESKPKLSSIVLPAVLVMYIGILSLTGILTGASLSGVSWLLMLTIRSYLTYIIAYMILGVVSVVAGVFEYLTSKKR